MLFYTQHITPRVTYMVSYLNEKMGLGFKVTSDLQEYIQASAFKVNYSTDRVCENEFFIRPFGLLQQTGTQQPTIEVFRNEFGLTAFFQTSDSDLSFDLLSASFFLLSRYEEYGHHESDEYGRYAHWNALAWRHGFMEEPLVDQWLLHFKGQLIHHFRDLQFETTAFSYCSSTFLPTYDIDIAWSVKNKGWLRLCGSILKQPFSLIEKFKILSGLQRDPFDCYSWLEDLHKVHQLHPVYFFLVAGKRSALDKNIAPGKKAFQQLIQDLARNAIVGLHPSVYSNTSTTALKREKAFLQNLLHLAITRSRQHYLRFHLPHSYRVLIENGITDDYSMGYGTVNGFRASTSHSFLWYDLGLEQTTSLRIHPIACMDANYLYELKQSPEDALNSMKQMYERVHLVHGQFITIFHNSILGLDELDKGWAAMYKQFLIWQQQYQASNIIL